MILKKVLIFAMFCLFGCNVYAQVDINRIKNDRSYYSAEGVGLTREEAKQDAMAQITRQINVTIYNESSARDIEVSSYSDGNENLKGSHIEESVVTSVSSISLSNVEMMELSPEPEAKVFCWVHRDEVEKAYKQRETKILDYVKNGQIAERALQIDDAIRYYYWALMLSKTHPNIVKMKHENDMVDVHSFMPLKIKSVLSNITSSVESVEEADNRTYVNVCFKYAGHNVSSLQLKYFDGQSYAGPLTVRDGMAEMELVAKPGSGSVDFFYEYMFRKDAESLDVELLNAFKGTKPIIMKEAKASITLEKKKKKQKKSSAELNTAAVAVVDGVSIKTENVAIKTPIDMSLVQDDKEYRKVMAVIESAIKEKNPKLAYNHFTRDGYRMFDDLLTRTGTVSLVGAKQDYVFVQTPGRVFGRFCNVSVKFKNGRKFMEKLVFRFNKENKIESIAFALTTKAENDILNADAGMWKEVSRYAILQFMEDYQTAYTLKRLDYIDKIFSDDAIIIVGSILKSAPATIEEGRNINLGNEKVDYVQRTKSEYINKLRTQFRDKEYIHLTFENNELQLVNAPHRDLGTVFAIQIKQLYNSSDYSDQGYLTLVFDASRELPLIGVRLWQPDKTEMVKIQDFVKKFRF